jgi:hypothetical protein
VVEVVRGRRNCLMRSISGRCRISKRCGFFEVSFDRACFAVHVRFFAQPRSRFEFSLHRLLVRPFEGCFIQ